MSFGYVDFGKSISDKINDKFFLSNTVFAIETQCAKKLLLRKVVFFLLRGNMCV